MLAQLSGWVSPAIQCRLRACLNRYRDLDRQFEQLRPR